MSGLATTRADELTAAAAAPPARGRVALRRLGRRKGSIVGIAGLAVVASVAAFAPLISPYEPLAQDITNTLAPPVWAEGGSLEHVLGTDSLGRDVATRLAYGARNSLAISVAAALIGSLLGLITGLVAGFFGGWVDSVLMRLGDMQLAFPFILLAVVILGVIAERTVLHLILVLGVPGWIVYARVVRSRVLAEREKEYVTAARAVGASGPRTLFRYVLPSVWQVIPVIAMLDLGFLVIVESTLSFLGFGLTPPTPSWGSTLAEGRQFLVVSPWLPVLPGLAIMFTVLSINLTADGLADVVDPRLTKGSFRRQMLRLPSRYNRDRGDDQPLLRVRDLAVEFPLGERVVRAVRGISFDLERGQTVGIVGESGSGKSVTALAIIQLLDAPGRVTGGEILLDGQDLTRIDRKAMAALRGRRIGMIFQNPASSLNPVLTIGFQLTETIRTQLRLPQEKAESMARDALLSVGIGNAEHILRRYPFELSGGMNQRVMIAMAMAGRPDLLIADEPTTALDVTTQAQVLEQLRDVTRASDTSLILITHDIALVAEYADAILVMYAGQVCEAGPAETVIRDPKHPYTRALLDSLPRADTPSGARLQAIPGELPDPTIVPRGCPFAPRCPCVLDISWEINPELVEVGPGQTAACHLWTPDEARGAAR
ncbi:MAG: dipeptide/oligopeptide/nickel ABC transporter permease/ATP-binding protein [Gaiellaceae bacterium MAG52_C11]|nr:dipeptide/oligopeptide/nickel ABC transporter permease/ATP-binding protein [Candidatus Gaiellasilicea maunaloa]